jgi:hypothetical protein
MEMPTTDELYTEDERAADRFAKAAEARGGFATVMVLRDGTFHVVALWDAAPQESVDDALNGEIAGAADGPTSIE